MSSILDSVTRMVLTSHGLIREVPDGPLVFADDIRAAEADLQKRVAELEEENARIRLNNIRSAAKDAERIASLEECVEVNARLLDDKCSELMAMQRQAASGAVTDAIHNMLAALDEALAADRIAEGKWGRSGSLEQKHEARAKWSEFRIARASIAAQLSASPQPAVAESVTSGRMHFDSFIAEAKRTGITAQDLAKALAQRPEFADCLTEAETSATASVADIHSCSYFCDRPECIKTQRDELRQMFDEANKPAPLKVPTCEWSLSTEFDGDTYESACGEKWSFIEGGIAENGVKFCQGCGGRVVQKGDRP